jgi:hypothetical protein
VEIVGSPKKIKAAKRVEKKQGQIRRGAGRFAMANQSTVPNATRLLHGRIRKAEASTSTRYQFLRQLPTLPDKSRRSTRASVADVMAFSHGWPRRQFDWMFQLVEME